MTIATTNATVPEIEAALRGGKKIDEVVREFMEPRNNVIAVWQAMRQRGESDGAPSAPAAAKGAADDLLAAAERSPSKRIQAAGKRAQAALDKVRDLIEADAGKAAARARVARLEAELRAAKAALKGTPVADAPSVDTKAVRAWAEANGVAVPARGRIPQAIVAAYTEAQAS